MKRYVEGRDRAQVTLLPEYLDDYIAEDNPVRAVDAFVEELDLRTLGFEGAEPAITGRPSYHPAVLLKIYIYGYLNRIPSSRRLEREAQRNVELMWLTGQLAPDFKTIADFRRDNGEAIRKVCREFIELSRQLGLFGEVVVASGPVGECRLSRSPETATGRVATVADRPGAGVREQEHNGEQAPAHGTSLRLV